MAPDTCGPVPTALGTKWPVPQAPRPACLGHASLASFHPLFRGYCALLSAASVGPFPGDELPPKVPGLDVWFL